MIFGTDFWKWAQFAIAVLKLIANIFGDEGDKKQANNHFSNFTPKT